MSEHKHTPGPWRVEGYHRVGAAEAGHIISHGINAYGDGPEGYVCNTSGTTHADARLIAAAPQLLEAGNCVLRSKPLFTGEQDVVLIAKSDLDALRAAIAAATGDA